MKPANTTEPTHAPDCDLDEDCSCGVVESTQDYLWSDRRVSVGRVVHYHTQDPKTFEVEGPYAATVVSCDQETGLCELDVLFPLDPRTGLEQVAVPIVLFASGRDGRYRMHGIPFSSEPQAGCWSWPPRV